MRMDNLLLVEKVTEYIHNQKSGTFQSASREERERMVKKHAAHINSMDQLESILDGIFKNVTRVSSDALDGIDPDSYDLCVAAGGDGTFLKVAAMIERANILGVNTNPTADNNGSLGNLCSLNVHELEKLKAPASNYKVDQWMRLGASVNGRQLPYVAVNEIAILPVNPFKSSELTQRVDGIEEHFTGSGAIISTPRGSTAWFWSATGGVVIHPNLKAYGIANREVYEKRIKPAYHHIIVPDDMLTEVVPRKHEYCMAFNSATGSSVTIKPFDKIEVYKSDKPLNVVSLS